MNTTPTACLIIIGNEILSGRTQDKNLGWLAEHLNEIGVQMQHCRVIPDIEQTIIDTVNECRRTYDYVFTTGGIGPTHDDITAVSVAKAFGVTISRHPEAEARLLAHYKPEDVNEARMKMANIPEGATLIDNPVSAAPGFQIENVFVLAGVPRIMQAMFDHFKERLVGGVPTLSRSLDVDYPEGRIAEKLSTVDAAFPEVEIGCYPLIKNGKLGSSIVLRSQDEAKLDEGLQAVHAMLKSL